MPAKLYSIKDEESGETHYSFSRDSLADYEGEVIEEHDAAAFFHQEAETLASGHDAEHSEISKRELAELFCELYKV